MCRNLKLGKSILLISPEGWGKSHVSKHHYAKALAEKGFEVFFLNPPSRQFKRTKLNQRLFLIDYRPVFRGLSKMPHFIAGYLIKREVRCLEKRLQVKFNIIWNFDTSRFFNLSRLENRLRICHVVDMCEDHNRVMLASTTDICFCTSDYILKELQPFNANCFKIHHGYQTHFTGNSEVVRKARIQVGMVGNLTRTCIHWSLLIEIISKYPEIDFNLVGSTGNSNLSSSEIEAETMQFLQSSSNVILKGQIAANNLPSVISEMDIMICTYRVESKEEIAQHSNLHKIMEYLGSGKAIVTTYVDEYKDVELGMLEMAKTPAEFKAKFDNVLLNLDYYNSDDLMKKRTLYALDNSYPRQIGKIERIIEKYVR